MEVLELQGYTEFEKLRIAEKYLIPRQIKENGIGEKNIKFVEEALSHVIRRYTREAGVRNLEREIGTICRKEARRIAEAKSKRPKSKRPVALNVTPKVVEEFLGAPKICEDAEVAERTNRPGVVTGLAWTPTGGDVLFVEAISMVGSGKNLNVTGRLGKVMQESMHTALSWVRSNAKSLGIDPKVFKTTDIHIHVPSGAIPKDGPSAGVTVVTSLTSLLTGRKVRSLTAMTGEATLSGMVLPVGGIKEKVLAARRAGIKQVLLPKDNEVNVSEDLNDEQIGDLKIHYVKTLSEAVRAALTPARRTAKKKASKRGRAAARR